MSSVRVPVDLEQMEALSRGETVTVSGVAPKDILRGSTFYATYGNHGYKVKVETVTSAVCGGTPVMSVAIRAAE